VLLGSALLLLSGGALVGGSLLLRAAGSSVHQEHLLGDTAPEVTERHVEITGAKKILLVGSDARPWGKPSDTPLADSIIILSIDAAHTTGYLTSIPRDTWVTIPAYDNGARRFPGGHGKINSAYATGGDGLTGEKARAHSVELLAKTIKQAYGVSFDAAAIVDFVGFQKVVDVLGGVSMVVDEETTSVHRGLTRDGKIKVPYTQYTRRDGTQGLDRVAGVTPITYHVGPQHLSAAEALDFVRQRELLPNGDYDRERHQQQFIKALLRQIVSADVLTNPVKLTRVLDIIGSAVTLDPGGVPVKDWIYAMRGLTPDHIVTINSNKGTFHPAAENPGAESLDAETVELLGAVRDGTVDAFVIHHPDLVSQGG
jgi:LCP family protein required for cell wall assembly